MALYRTPPAQPGARRGHRQQSQPQWFAIMRVLALASSALWLSLSPAAAQDSASGTILAPMAASSTGHFVSGVADALPKVPNHTQNAQNPQNGPALNLPAHPVVLHPVMPTLPVIPAPHTISTAVTAGPAPARQVTQVNAVPSPAAAPVAVPSTAANPPHAASATALVDTPGAGLLPAPRIDPSIGSANVATAPSNPTNSPQPLAAASSNPSSGGAFHNRKLRRAASV